MACSVSLRESLLQPIFDMAMDQMNVWFHSTTEESEDDAQECTQENTDLTQEDEQEKEIQEEEECSPSSSYEEY